MTITNKLKDNAFLFFCTGVVILIIGFVFFRGVFDITIHDTYLVIDRVHITLVICICFLFVSGVYFSFSKLSKPLNTFWGSVHYIITVVCLIVFVFPPEFLFDVKRYTPGTNVFATDFDVNDLLAIFGLFFLLAQFIFVINVIYSLFRKKLQKA